MARRTTLQRRRARVRLPSEGPGQEPRRPLRGERSRHEGPRGRSLEVQAPRRRRCPPAQRRTPGRAPRPRARARPRTRRAGLAPVAHPHRHHRPRRGHRRRVGGSMEPIVTPQEMGDADRRTIAAGTPVEVLMERAGRSVAWAVRRRLDGVYGRRAVVVCGKGNNGGDGLVAARVLAGWGVQVDVAQLADPPDAAALGRMLDRADFLVDAMYGTG